MNVLAACGGEGNAGPQGRLQVQRRTTTAPSRTIRRSSPRRWTARTRRARRSSATSSTPSAPCASSPLRNPHVTVTVLRFANGLGPALRTSLQPALRPARRARASSASTRAFSSSTRTTSPAAWSTRCATTSTGVYNGAADGVLVAQRGRRAAGQAARARPAAGGRPALAAGALRRAGLRISPEMLGLLRYGRGLDNRKLKATGYRYRYTSREAVIKLREHQRLAAILGDAARRPTATSATSRSSCAAARACGRRARPPAARPRRTWPRASAAAPASAAALRRLRRPRRRGAHRSAALARARGAGRARRARARARRPPGGPRRR